jgi:hypothetical protein
MNKRSLPIAVYFIYSLCILSSCKEGKVEFNANTCKGNPAFIRSLGFDSRYSFFSTSDISTMGLLLLQSDEPGNPNARITGSFQHPSWKKGGWLAPIVLDESGNIFTAPAPFINILYNPIVNNNTVYRIDSKTGGMEEFLRLPFADSINTENPFGIIGMIYLCETGTLYVSTVAGSRRYEENGHIYVIDIRNKKIIDQLDHTDVMGMGITYITGQRKLFFGNGRNSDVMSVKLSSKGKFTGTPHKEFTLENLGPRGDDKIRRIRTDQYGNLIVHGMEFNFNLIAPREKQETIYNFYYDEDSKKWNYRN